MPSKFTCWVFLCHQNWDWWTYPVHYNIWPLEWHLNEENIVHMVFFWFLSRWSITEEISLLRLSRFHRSAGLDDTPSSGRNSPVLSASPSSSKFAFEVSPNMAYPNPRYPPYPTPTVVKPLVQLRQPLLQNLIGKFVLLYCIFIHLLIFCVVIDIHCLIPIHNHPGWVPYLMLAFLLSMLVCCRFHQLPWTSISISHHKYLHSRTF